MGTANKSTQHEAHFIGGEPRGEPGTLELTERMKSPQAGPVWFVYRCLWKISCCRAFVVVHRVAHHGKLSDFPRISWTDLLHLFLLILASSKIERRKDAQSHKLETEGDD